VSAGQQPEFRSLSEFYIIIFLNKLKIVENTPRGPKAVLFRLAKFFLENLVLNAKKKR
jgi:hypothetical protein